MDNSRFITEFENIINKLNPKKVFFVSSKEYDRFGYRKALEKLGINVVSFTGFEPCPETKSVRNGVDLLKSSGCDLMTAVGGGSAIDCAKGIKYYADSDIKIIAVPTTAGTGAEVTKTAVLYENGDKQSVKDVSLIPEYAIFDYDTLETLPTFQKIVTGFDAFCHSFEAYISKNSNDESKRYSVESLKLFANNFDAFIEGDKSAFESMMKCSELAGRAINIAQTASPHAFSYKLHKLLGFAHGQACVISLVYIWKYMAENSNDEVLIETLSFLEKLTGFNPSTLEQYIKKLGLLDSIIMSRDEFEETVNGVNLERIKNNPMKFGIDDVRNIYSSFILVK